MSEKPLDPKVLADLTRAARGVGRKATFAHPDCICINPETKQFSEERRQECSQHQPGHRRARVQDETPELFDAEPLRVDKRYRP